MTDQGGGCMSLPSTPAVTPQLILLMGGHQIESVVAAGLPPVMLLPMPPRVEVRQPPHTPKEPLNPQILSDLPTRDVCHR